LLPFTGVSERRRAGKWTGWQRAGLCVLGAIAVTAGLTWRSLPLLRHLSSQGPVPPTALEALVRRQHEGLATLIARAEAGPMVPAGQHALVGVDQKLVQSLLSTLVPADYVVSGRYRIHVARATVSFEDGFALVTLSGRASLVGREQDVFADVTVYGDLDVERTQRSREVLQTRIRLIAFDARRVAVVVESRRAERLVEELGRERIEQFAALASSLEIPVRQDYALEVPPAGPEGPVQIAGAAIPVQLTVLDVTAFAGRLWVSMAAAIGPGAVAPATPPLPARPHPIRPPALMARLHRQQHQRLEKLLARDPVVAEAMRTPGDVVIAVRSEFARAVVRQVARSYFDHVVIDLRDLDVYKQGDLQKKTPLGRMRVGEWEMDMRVHRVKGVLRAGTPEVRFREGNRIQLEFPVHLEQGQGRATLDFAYDSKGIASLVCKDFQAEQTVQGGVIPEAYEVEGSFTLHTGPRSLTARPSFPDEFKIKLDLDPGSWAAVRARLQREDRLGRCGLALDPDKALRDLRALAARGFDVRLPAQVFRTVALPSEGAQQVQVDGQSVRVRVSQNALHLGPVAVWYSARVAVEIPATLRAHARSSTPRTPSWTAQCAQQKKVPSFSTPWPTIVQPQCSQVGASAWIAHSKLSNTWLSPPMVTTNALS
jgi:hypothetical protein